MYRQLTIKDCLISVLCNDGSRSAVIDQRLFWGEIQVRTTFLRSNITKTEAIRFHRSGTSECGLAHTKKGVTKASGQAIKQICHYCHSPILIEKSIALTRTKGKINGCI